MNGSIQLCDEHTVPATRVKLNRNVGNGAAFIQEAAMKRRRLAYRNARLLQQEMGVLPTVRRVQ